MLTLHLDCHSEISPEVIDKKEVERNGESRFEITTLSGRWSRVFPKSATDVLFLRSLEHRMDKFAPARGDGVIVRSSMLPARFSPKN